MDINWQSHQGEEYVSKVGSSGDISGIELKGADMGESGTEVCSSIDISGVNVDSNIDRYPLGDKQLFTSEFKYKVDTYVGIPDVKVGSYVGISGYIGDGYPLEGKSLGADGGSYIGSFNGILYGSGYGKLDVYPLEEKSIGVDCGAEIGSSNSRSYGSGDGKLYGYWLGSYLR